MISLEVITCFTVYSCAYLLNTLLINADYKMLVVLG